MRRRFRWEMIGAILGAIGGWLYWYFWGCTEGCPLRSNWYVMVPYSMVLGGLAASLIHDFIRLRRTKSR